MAPTPPKHRPPLTPMRLAAGTAMASLLSGVFVVAAASGAPAHEPAREAGWFCASAQAWAQPFDAAALAGVEVLLVR